MYTCISSKYLQVMPKQLRDRILDEKFEGISDQIKVDAPAEKTEKVPK